MNSSVGFAILFLLLSFLPGAGIFLAFAVVAALTAFVD